MHIVFDDETTPPPPPSPIIVQYQHLQTLKDITYYQQKLKMIRAASSSAILENADTSSFSENFAQTLF